MIYHYLASNKAGKKIEGNFETDDIGRVLQYLASQELRPLTVTPIKTGSEADVRHFFGGINLSDKIFLTRYLSLMLRVGTDLISAVNILIADYEKLAMKTFLIELQANLAKGQPFYQPFSKYPRVFSPVFVNLVKAAEKSGRLQQTFEDLSVSLQKEADLRGKIRGALLYPVILLAVSFVVFSFLALFALPKIAKVFSDSGIEPPLFSRITFQVGLFFGDHFLAIVLFGSVLIGLITYFFGYNIVGQRIREKIVTKTPIIKTVYYNLAIQRFSSTLAALMKASLPIIEAIQITADVVGSQDFKKSLLRIADEGLAKGLTIGDAFKREKIFPTVITNLIAISEKVGHTEEVLETISDFYGANVDASIRSLVSVLEPLLLVAMGLIAGVIALAIILPIYQLSSQF